MRIAPLRNLPAARALPGGEGGGPGSVSPPPARRSYPAAAMTRRDGRLFTFQMTIERVGGAEPPGSLMEGLVRDLSARTTAERLAAAALRKYLAEGVPPSRGAIERAFAETQAAVEKGVRLAKELMRSQGAGGEALGGAAEAGEALREALARWRARSV